MTGGSWDDLHGEVGEEDPGDPDRDQHRAKQRHLEARKEDFRM